VLLDHFILTLYLKKKIPCIIAYQYNGNADSYHFVCVIQPTKDLLAMLLRIKSMKYLVMSIFVAVSFQCLSLLVMLMTVILFYLQHSFYAAVNMAYTFSGNLNF
jgi:hypothetical protein